MWQERYFCEQFTSQSVKSGNVHSSESLSHCRFSLQRKSFCTFKSQAWIFGTRRCSSFVLSFSLLSSFSLSSAFLLLLLLRDLEAAPGSFLRMFLMLALDLRKLFLQHIYTAHCTSLLMTSGLEEMSLDQRDNARGQVLNLSDVIRSRNCLIKDWRFSL